MQNRVVKKNFCTGCEVRKEVFLKAGVKDGAIQVWGC